MILSKQELSARFISVNTPDPDEALQHALEESVFFNCTVYIILMHDGQYTTSILNEVEIGKTMGEINARHL